MTSNITTRKEINTTETEENGDYGTFKDSKRLPIHRWFQYPAGYSPKLVYQKIREFNLSKDSLIFDPFLGCGTTCVAAREKGIGCVGIEAHGFVADIASTKLFWEYDIKTLKEDFQKIIFEKFFDPKISKKAEADFNEIPELVKKCFSKDNLINLLKIKHSINLVSTDKRNKEFLKLALTSTLRLSTFAGTGWPYIAPSKYQGKKTEKEGVSIFKKQFSLMISDIEEINRICIETPPSTVIKGDSRILQDISKESVDLALTSPPYLNNYDYADRTRFETYFFGIAKDWGDITEKFRNKLIVAATTQTKRTNFDPHNCISEDIIKSAPEIAEEITEKVVELSKRRLTKGGKKSYDIMVAQYFNDVFPILKNTYYYLKNGGAFVLVLGDSAPYGVHIPTETYIGELGKAIGFKFYEIEELRTRGDKWANNPQRHSVKLRESLITLFK